MLRMKVSAGVRAAGGGGGGPRMRVAQPAAPVNGASATRVGVGFYQ